MFSYPWKIIKKCSDPFKILSLLGSDSFGTISLNSTLHVRQLHVIQMTACLSLHRNIVPEFPFQLEGSKFDCLHAYQTPVSSKKSWFILLSVWMLFKKTTNCSTACPVLFLKHLQGWWLYYPPWQTILVLNHPFSKEIPHDVQPEPPLLQLEAISSFTNFLGEEAKILEWEMGYNNQTKFSQHMYSIRCLYWNNYIKLHNFIN